MQPANEAYMRAYMQGYTDAMEKAAATRGDDKPYIDLPGVIERYGGIGEAKARSILEGVRHVCGGGKIGLATKVLKSELEYWESIVDKQFVERLYDGRSNTKYCKRT